MDKEAQEIEYTKNPMRQRIIAWLVEYDTAFDRGTLPSVSETVDQIISLVLPKDKPPIVAVAMEDVSKGVANELIQAQRKADIKFYEGK